MADTYIKFSDLKDTHPSPIDGAHDLLAIAHKDAQTDDYVSMTVTPNDVGSHAVEDMTFSNLKTSSKTVRTAINQTISNLAEDYSSTSTYALNDCVLYEGLLYKCTTAISTPEEWTLAHWTQIKAVDVGSGGGGGVAWTDIIGTLIAGQTSLTLQNVAITESSTIDYYTDIFGISPTNAVVTNGQIVLTFEAQSSDLGVKVRVS